MVGGRPQKKQIGDRARTRARRTTQTHTTQTKKTHGYLIDAFGVDTDYDLWEFWHDSRSRLPHWYEVVKDIALIQPFSAFSMERVFSILRACMDERQELSFSDRIAVSALFKYNRGQGE